MQYILLIDDEQSILNSTKLILNFRGFKVVSHDNASDGINDIKSNPEKISHVILDIMLPDMSGSEVLQEVEDIIKEYNIPVIVHSGMRAEDIFPKLVNLGAKHYLIKPYKIDDLLVLL
ncbi:MAG: response regulator [Rickettsiaceae bacterium]|nr:response regulator [Rickettsiaceae bacterium]